MAAVPAGIQEVRGLSQSNVSSSSPLVMKTLMGLKAGVISWGVYSLIHGSTLARQGLADRAPTNVEAGVKTVSKLAAESAAPMIGLVTVAGLVNHMFQRSSEKMYTSMAAPAATFAVGMLPMLALRGRGVALGHMPMAWTMGSAFAAVNTYRVRTTMTGEGGVGKPPAF